MDVAARASGMVAAALVAGSLVVPGLSGSSEQATDHSLPPRLAALSWMVGHWAGESAGVRSEEWWTPASGGVMLGLHRDVGSDGDAFFEFLRIVERDSGLVYVAQPMGRTPTEFAMIALQGERVVFENPEHDFPQRIIYSNDLEGRLVARIEGDIGGEPRSSQWRWSRVE